MGRSASAPAPAFASPTTSALAAWARSAVRARALSRLLHSAWAVASSGRSSCSPHASRPKSSAAELTQREEVLASKTARQLKSVAPSASAAPG